VASRLRGAHTSGADYSFSGTRYNRGVDERAVTSAANDLAHTLRKVFGRTHQNIHADLAELPGHLAIVLRLGVVAEGPQTDQAYVRVGEALGDAQQLGFRPAVVEVRNQDQDRARRLAYQTRRILQGAGDVRAAAELHAEQDVDRFTDLIGEVHHL